jgi:hypothetical protein
VLKPASQLSSGDILWLPEKVPAGKLYPPSQTTVKRVELLDCGIAAIANNGQTYFYGTGEDVDVVAPFCANHIATLENHTGTDCSAHLAEGRVFSCPYRSPDHAKHGRMLDGQRVCPDYRPME